MSAYKEISMLNNENNCIYLLRLWCNMTPLDIYDSLTLLTLLAQYTTCNVRIFLVVTLPNCCTSPIKKITELVIG